jgi:4-hydroxy-2-oxoheptanedioate aldolase
MKILQKNLFKTALARHSAQIGLWISLGDAYSAEICAGADFDWLLIDGEHAPNDVRSILAQLQALAAYPVHPVVRPPVGEVAFIKQLLDIGAQSLLIPMVETAEQAQLLVSACRYPPVGIRGVGSALARASHWNGIPGYLDHADQQICLLVQIETRRGLENIEEIGAVEGVDGLFVGPADLSAALGHRGNPEHPDVQAAITDAIKRIRAAGKAAGILARDENLSRQYLTQGCSFVAVGADVTLLSRGARELAAKFKTDQTDK